MSFLNAFVLGFSDFSDYDRWFSLLTNEHGKIRAICKSILKPNAKLAGHLDIPSLSWVELVWSVRGWQITQALELETFANIRKNPEALKAVLSLAKTFDQLLYAEDDREFKGRLPSANTDRQNEGVYVLWQDFLKTIEQWAQKNTLADYKFVAAQGLIKILHQLGFLPDTFVCSRCNQPFKSKFVTYLENQFYCDICRQALSLQGRPLPKSVLDLIGQGLKGLWLAQSTYAKEYIQLSRWFSQLAP
jgi:recombinational DNA repair protein (RecF pathway)